MNAEILLWNFPLCPMELTPGNGRYMGILPWAAWALHQWWVSENRLQVLPFQMAWVSRYFDGALKLLSMVIKTFLLWNMFELFCTSQKQTPERSSRASVMMWERNSFLAKELISQSASNLWGIHPHFTGLPVYIKTRKASWDMRGNSSADGRTLNMENSQATHSLWARLLLRHGTRLWRRPSVKSFYIW